MTSDDHWPECCDAWVIEHHPTDQFGLFRVRCECRPDGYWKPGGTSVTITIPRPKEKKVACECKCTCPLEVGDKIRHTKVYQDGIRLGHAEPKFVTYLSDEWAGYKCYNQRGQLLGEFMLKRGEFAQKFERDPS